MANGHARKDIVDEIGGANDAVQQPVLQGAPDIGSRDLGTRGGDVKLHDL